MTLLRLANQPRFNDMFDSMLEKNFDFDRFYGGSYGCLPKTNIMEDENVYKLEFVAPGMKKADFKVNLENNQLTVSAELETEENSENLKFTRKEFVARSFKRKFSVPNTVESEKIKADYKNGILTVTLPKKEEVKMVKEIKIS